MSSAAENAARVAAWRAFGLHGDQPFTHTDHRTAVATTASAIGDRTILSESALATIHVVATRDTVELREVLGWPHEVTRQTIAWVGLGVCTACLLALAPIAK